MNLEEYAAFALNRRDAYRILSTLYFAPETNTLAELGSLRAALDEVCTEAAEFVEDMGQDSDLQELNVDYSKLFVGPFRLLAAPYGSVYLEGKREIMGSSTLDARDRYRDAGLDFSDNVKEAPDHIAFELEFLYYLIFKEIESLASGDVSAARDFLRRQKAFLIDHLGAWTPRFASEVEQHAQTSFYQNLARATRAFVREDLPYVADSEKAYVEA